MRILPLLLSWCLALGCCPSTLAGFSITDHSPLSSPTALAAKRGGNNKTKKKTKKPVSGPGGFGKEAGKWQGCEPLRAWLRDKGANVEGINVGVVGEHGLRGVTAARDYKRGDVLFSIPRETCILDVKKADSSPMAAMLYPTAPEKSALAPPIRVALFLLWLERVPLETAAWEPALAVFPTKADFEADGGPMELWSDAEVAEVEDPSLIAEVHIRSKSLREDYDERIYPQWAAAAAMEGGPLAGIPPPSFVDFQHQVCVVTSRNFGEGEEDSDSASMLVPGADLCNHDDPGLANTKHALAPWGDFVVLAKTAIPAGKEVLLSYGPLPNRLLLAQFGFLLCDRETPLVSDTALVRIDGLFSDNDKGDKEGDRPATAQSEAAADKLWQESPGPWRLINLGQANKSAKGLVSRWQPAAAARAAAEEMDGVNDGKELFRGLLERELSGYSSSLQEDEAKLASVAAGLPDDSLPVRSLWALHFRIESKRLLTKELLALDA